LSALGVLRCVSISSYVLAAMWVYLATAAACDGRYLAAALFGLVGAVAVVAWSSALLVLAEEKRCGPD
jgi:hypothetical protein